MVDDRLPVLVVIGTRPEAIKMFPIAQRLAQSEVFRPVVVTTGQHRHLVDPILEFAGVPVEHDLAVGRPGLTVNDLVAAVMQRMDGILTHFAPTTRLPAWCLVHGDTSSAMAAALAAFHNRVPVAHIEAGLRTHDPLTPFPEEMNRQLLARLAAFHLAPTFRNKENLVLEGIPFDQIFVTGNSGIDALRWAAAQGVPPQVPELAYIDDDPRPLVVVTAHRRENWGPGLAGIVEGVRRVAMAQPESVVVWPVHPNPIVRSAVEPVLAELPNVVLTPPLGYAEFANLMNRAHLVVTDSGGIQEEAPALGTPVLVARESTERDEAVESGAVRLVGTDPAVIEAEALRLLRDAEAHAAMAGRPSAFGDGQASERIVQALEYLAGHAEEPAALGSGFSRDVVRSRWPIRPARAV